MWLMLSAWLIPNWYVKWGLKPPIRKKKGWRTIFWRKNYSDPLDEWMCRNGHGNSWSLCQESPQAFPFFAGTFFDPTHVQYWISNPRVWWVLSPFYSFGIRLLISVKTRSEKHSRWMVISPFKWKLWKTDIHMLLSFHDFPIGDPFFLIVSPIPTLLKMIWYHCKSSPLEVYPTLDTSNLGKLDLPLFTIFNYCILILFPLSQENPIYKPSLTTINHY